MRGSVAASDSVAWMPAFAGMTVVVETRVCKFSNVIPAQAGIQASFGSFRDIDMHADALKERVP